MLDASVTSKLDYCNVLICGLSGNTSKILQRDQKYAACMLDFELGRSEHITHVLHGGLSLLWIPVYMQYSIKLK